MAPHQQRVIDEKAELDDKLKKLQKFITGELAVYISLPDEEKQRLKEQFAYMNGYSAVLGDRIAAFPPTEAEPAMKIV
jgi:hypothetical protein